LSLDDSELPAGVMSEFTRVFAINGIDLTLYKPSFIKRRLDRRMNILDISEYDMYVKMLIDNHKEFEEISSSLHINVTSFFRDPDVFNTFKTSILPRLFSNLKSSQKIRIWSAGCASGEEAYSVALMIYQVVDKFNIPNVEIIANDVNYDAIQFAQRGKYSSKNIESLPNDVVSNNFHKVIDSNDDVHYEIGQHIKKMITFRQGDILSYNIPFFDIVFCRNVLIYYEPEAQDLILTKFYTNLKNGGYLILGMDETLFGRRCHKLFHPLMLRERIYQKIPTR
jgi:chemotaxis methyl-accepting protein methylase